MILVSTGASFADYRMLSGAFRPGGTSDISYQDPEFETQFAKSLGVPLFRANVSQRIYQMARATGLGKEDGAAIVKLYDEMAGARLGPRWARPAQLRLPG